MDKDDELRLLRGACAASQTGAWHYRVGEDVIEWTPLLYELFGVSKDTALTLDLGLSFYVGRSKALITSSIERCLNDGTPWNLDLQCLSATGRFFWSRAIGVALFENGRVIALQGAFQDITRERLALDERARAQSELSFVLRTMPDGFFLLNNDWRFTFVNDASRKILRRDSLELVGKCIWEEFPEACNTIVEYAYRSVKETGESQSFQTYFAPLMTWFDITVHPAQTGVAVHFRDVTQGVREKHELILFRAALDALTSGAIMVKCSPGEMALWPVTYANRAAENQWEIDHHALPLVPLGEIIAGTVISPDIREIGRSLIHMAMCNFVAIRESHGRKQILECVAVPLADQDGKCQHVVILVDDVTEQRRSDEERHRSERLALVGQMAGGVSHDFNNLLAVILGNVELLEFATDPTEVEILISEARAAVMRGKSLNDSLLAFAGKSRLKPQTADLGTFLRSLTPLVRRAVPSRIKLELDIAETLPPVLIDTAMLESCLLNVAINARESIEGTGTIRIALDAVQRGSPNGESFQTLVRLSVEDTGCGIADHLHEQVFEPFFTTREIGQGSGLGLSRVRGYLDQIGGFVSLYSAEGQGTTVSMFFKVAAVDTRETDHLDFTIESSPKSRLKALVVDDTPAVAHVVAGMLSSLGCHTLVAANGTEARKIVIRESDLDLIISDVVMPGESGIELASALKATHPHLRIALMSGYSQDNLGSPHQREGIVFFAKPVSRKQLYEFIRTGGNPSHG